MKDLESKENITEDKDIEELNDHALLNIIHTEEEYEELKGYMRKFIEEIEQEINP